MKMLNCLVFDMQLLLHKQQATNLLITLSLASVLLPSLR